MTLRLMTLSATVAVFASPALAQQVGPLTPEQREARFVSSDKNKDGKLDLAEWKAFLPAQMLARHGDNLDAVFGSRDTDGDKFISKAEYAAPPQIGGPRLLNTIGNR